MKRLMITLLMAVTATTTIFAKKGNDGSANAAKICSFLM